MVKEDMLKENKVKTESELDIYIGNLPRDYEPQELVNFLKEHGVMIDECNARCNPHRGFAQVRVVKNAAGALKLRDTVWCNRAIVVERAGADEWSQLKLLCQRRAVGLPSLKVEEHRDSGTVKYIAVATWPSLGDVLIQARGVFGTRKEARKAMAKECLVFLERQLQDHEVEAERRNDKEGATNEEGPQESAEGKMVPLVVNLIDSPGHIDFNGEVTAALRISDGALVVVDAVEGKAVQTEEVLRQALREGVRPVLMINKVDRLLLDKKLEPDEVYDALQCVVDDINNFIVVHQLPEFPDQRVSFENGSVCFGSGYFGWSCSLDTFVHRTFVDTSIDSYRVHAILAKRENFIKYVIKPIMRMHRACGVLPLLRKDAASVSAVVRVNNLLSQMTKRQLRLIDEELPPRKLLKKAMMAWLPAADAIVDMLALHVPSPTRAQQLRAPILYAGDLNDESGTGIAACDSTAPAVVYVSKIASGPDDRKPLAFGRVFSGTIRTGDVLRALRTDGTESEAKIARIKMFGVGKSATIVQSAFAGQLIALEGVDEALSKAGTLTASPTGSTIRHMNMSVTPTLHHSVRPKEKRLLNKVVIELRKIVNADATALFYKDAETQEYILAGAGELHIEVLISSLLQASGIEVHLSEPIIGYRETVESVSPVSLAKSDNKHNRVFIRVSPIAKEIVDAMASKDLIPKELGKVLASKFGWNTSEAAKLWAVGPEPIGHGQNKCAVDQPTCVLVDSTFGLQIPQDFKENVTAAFQQVTREGLLVNSPLSGVRFELVDAKFHSDAPHRRPNSVVPAASRAMRGAFLMAEPTLVEPVYRVDISGRNVINKAYSVIGQRSGVVVEASDAAIEALVPVRCATGLADALRHATQGHAHCSTVYNGMQSVPAEDVAEVISGARRRKNLKETLPTADSYIDKL